MSPLHHGWDATLGEGRIAQEVSVLSHWTHFDIGRSTTPFTSPQRL